jgi:hypothetical protein
MSLLKIPLIIASAVGVHVSLTTSHRPPSSEEKVMPTVFESLFKWLVGFRGLELVVVRVVLVKSVWI